MKSNPTPWRWTPLTGFRDCKKSEPTPRRNSVTNRSNAVPTHTRMASITRTLRDGGGRTGRNKLALTKMQRRKDVVCTLEGAHERCNRLELSKPLPSPTVGGGKGRVSE